MFPLALLFKPIIDLLASFLKPLIFIGIAVFVDLMLGIGLTDWAVTYVVQWAQGYVANNWGQFV